MPLDAEPEEVEPVVDMDIVGLLLRKPQPDPGGDLRDFITKSVGVFSRAVDQYDQVVGVSAPAAEPGKQKPRTAPVVAGGARAVGSRPRLLWEVLGVLSTLAETILGTGGLPVVERATP